MPTARDDRGRDTVGLLAVGVAVALVGAAIVLGRDIAHDIDTRTGAAPFHGRWRLLVTWRVLPAMAFAVAVVAGAPRVCRRASWRVLLVGSTTGAAAWAVLLELVDSLGARTFTLYLSSRYDYLAAVPRVGSPGRFLADFVEAAPTLPTHVKSHPPGMPLLLWALDRLGFGGPGWEAALVIAVGASAAAAALVAVRAVAGEATARAAAPYLVLAPAACFLGTSVDAFYTGLSAWAVALTVLAASGSRLSVAAAGGLLFGMALLFSYGVALLLLVPAAVVATRRRLDVAVLAGMGTLVPLVVAAAFGFSWPEGLAAARDAYRAGISSSRPYAYFLLANLAVLVVVVGPAVVAGLATVVRDRCRVAVIVVAALAAVVVADLSGLSKGEVERIWLPFTPWLVVAATAMTPSRRWLAGQAGTSLLLQLALRSPW